MIKVLLSLSANMKKPKGRPKKRNYFGIKPKLNENERRGNGNTPNDRVIDDNGRYVQVLPNDGILNGRGNGKTPNDRVIDDNGRYVQVLPNDGILNGRGYDVAPNGRANDETLNDGLYDNWRCVNDGIPNRRGNDDNRRGNDDNHRGNDDNRHGNDDISRGNETPKIRGKIKKRILFKRTTYFKPLKIKYFDLSDKHWSCIVKDCPNTHRKSPETGLIRFPTSPEKLKTWINNLELNKYQTRIGKQIKMYNPPTDCYVCEHHFKLDEPLEDQVPTIRYQSLAKRPRNELKNETLPPNVRENDETQNPLNVREFDETTRNIRENDENSPNVQEYDETTRNVRENYITPQYDESSNTPNIYSSSHDDPMEHLINMYDDLSLTECKSLLKSKDKLLETMKQELAIKEASLKETTQILEKYQEGITIKSFKTEILIRRCLGVPTEICFRILLEEADKFFDGKRAVFYGEKYEEKRQGRVLKKFRKRALSREQELIITLLMLRQGIHQDALSVIFKVHQATISRIFNMMINFLGSDKVFKAFVPWIDIEIVKQDTPKEYENITRIIDATEIKVERPASMEIAPLLWSSYKHFYGVKFIIGVTPYGSICFLSDGYGSRTSDKQLTAESGILDLLVPGEVIAVDRGFGIEEMLLARGCSLKMPPRAQGNVAFDNDQLESAKKIANQRIIVEQCIGRIRFFDIINKTLPWQYAESCDKIMKAICALTNLLPPPQKRE